MEAGLIAESAPIFWSLIALLLVCAGAILAGIDPELVEIYLGDPRWLLASAAIAVVAVVTIAAARPELIHGVRALLPD